MPTSVKHLVRLNPDNVFSVTAIAAATKGPRSTLQPDVDGNYSADAAHGFVNFQPADTFFSEVMVFSDQNIITSGTGTNAVTCLLANASGSNSAYAFFAQALLQNRAMSDRYSTVATGGFVTWLSQFRPTGDLSDTMNDPVLGIGDVGVISVKKIKFGEGIRPLHFVIGTTAGTLFRNTVSGDESWGLMTDQNNQIAGLVFYDLGVALIHGPSISAAQSISSTTAVTLQSTYKIWQFNALCTAGADDLRHPTNDSAFYKQAVTGDPIFNDSLTAYSTFGYQFGDGDYSLSATRGQYLLNGLATNWGPFITTIGLYNDQNDLVAVAKLSQPVKRPRTYPLTIRVSLDFDNYSGSTRRRPKEGSAE